jgi:hypothetical protein
MHDCIITVPFNEEVANKLEDDLLNKCQKIKTLVAKYAETKDENLFMWEPTSKDEFWLYNLCSYSSNYHKPFAEYLKKQAALKEYNEKSWIEHTDEEATDKEMFNNFFGSF